MKTFLRIVLTALLFAGCGTPRIVHMDGDTYLIQKRSAQVGFGPPEGAKAEVYAVANKFCEDRGLALETVNFTMVDSGFARPGSVALQFRGVPRNTKQSEMSSQAGSQNKGIEKRLNALNDLKDRRLINEDEYQKKRSEILKAL
jgi:hypothetical protein